MNNNVTEISDHQANRTLSTQDRKFIGGLRQLSPDNYAIVTELIHIMTECEGDIKKEVELMRKAGMPDHII